METKFEYQVSPELAEKIALEQLDVLLRLRGAKIAYLPVAFGFLVALIFYFLSFTLLPLNGGIFYSRSGAGFTLGGTSYAFTDGFLLAAVGFVLGSVIGILIRGFLRWQIVAAARGAYQKMGPARTLSWNQESLTFQSAGYETKIRWQMIDRIQLAELGVYGFFGRRPFFAIPRDAFPANATPQDLIKAWKAGGANPVMA